MTEFRAKTANGRSPAPLKRRFVLVMAQVITDREPCLDVYGEHGRWSNGRGPQFRLATARQSSQAAQGIGAAPDQGSENELGTYVESLCGGTNPS